MRELTKVKPTELHRNNIWAKDPESPFAKLKESILADKV